MHRTIRKGFIYTWAFMIILFTTSSVFIILQMKHLRKTIKKKSHEFHRIEYEVVKSNPNVFPITMQNVCRKSESALVQDVKRVVVPPYPHAYNASIIENDHGSYYLFFRYDLLEKRSSNPLLPFTTHVGFVELDEKFEIVPNSLKTIDTGSLYSEDPRVIKSEGAYYLVYNDLTPIRTYLRTMRLAELDLQGSRVKYATNLDLHISPVEKNWMPFIKKEQVHFVYSVTPHKIIQLNNPEINQINHLLNPENPSIHSFEWEKKWGKIRGGTPARLVDGQYLAFFHSWFKNPEAGNIWYVMGAYTFESEPPFRITSISKAPIIFKGIYNTKHIHTAPRNIRCIFPAGFAFEKKNDKTLLHISCGENDCGIKIVTIEKDQLLNSLEPINSEKPVTADLVATEGF